MMDDQEYKVMRNYSHIFRQEVQIRHIYGLDLGRAISLRSILLFFASLGTIFFFHIVPPFSWIWKIPIINILDNILIKFILFPIVMTYFLTKKKLDGKNPVYFVIDYFRYLSSTKTYSSYRAIQPMKMRVQTEIRFRRTRGENGNDCL